MNDVPRSRSAKDIGRISPWRFQYYKGLSESIILKKSTKNNRYNESNHIPQCYSLFALQSLEALLAHTHVELKSHDRNVDPIVGALVAHGLATVATVMLPNADLLLVDHGPQIPEEGPRTQLARVRLDPLRSHLPHGVHLPEHDHRVLAGRYQLLRVTGVG